MLILDNNEIEEILSMEAVIDVLRLAYREVGMGRGGYVPRSDLVAEAGDGVRYALKTMSGVVPALGVSAIRLDSDRIHWPEVAGNLRRVKIPAASGKKYVGLVLLFSIETGEPLAIFPDGVVQRMRVGGSSALAADLLARKDARIMGLLGSGWQAGAQVMAMQAVRPLQQVKVYSPNAENRRAFAAEYSEKLDLDIIAVDTPQEAVEADIVACASNSLGAVLQKDWVQAGQHLTCVRVNEIPGSVFEQCHAVVINTANVAVNYHVVGDRGTFPELANFWESSEIKNTVQWLAQQTELCQVAAGQVPGRQSEEQITCFCNNLGVGYQFAAVGSILWQLAKEKSCGRQLPVEWFLQDVHP